MAALTIAAEGVNYEGHSLASVAPNHPDAISSSILKHLRLLQIAKNEDKLL